MNDWISFGSIIGVTIGLGISRLMHLDTWLKIVTVIICAGIGGFIDDKLQK
jgi:hypothetical protein